MISGLLKKITADRVGGILFMLLGVAAILEGYRLRPLRTRGVAGDDTFPFIIGVILLLLGGLMAFIVKSPPLKVTFPRGPIAWRMVGSLVGLFAYWALLPLLGYIPSTFLISTALFRLFGGYRWGICLIAAALLTSSLYLLFILFLKMPFPIGIFGI
jgi:putative tricarboxylic transport membrane protein